MVKAVRHTNMELISTIKELRKTYREKNAKIWKAVAEILERPRRRKVIVNLSKINRLTREGETVVVPGKVLAGGDITHKLTVAAFAFSNSAREKIKNAGGRAITILELLNENPKGSDVRIII